VVREASVAYRPRRMLTLTVEDDGGVLGIRFLHFYPSHLKLFQAGQSFRFNGEVRGGFLGLEMVHPRFVKADDATPLPTQLTPVYPTTAGLGQTTLRKLVERALSAPIADTLPADWLAALNLPVLEASIRLLHQPPLDCALNELESRRHPAWQRWPSTSCWRSSCRWPAHAGSGSRAGAAVAVQATADRRLHRHAAVHADRRADARLAGNQRRPQRAAPDARLLQGDVGSGKTVVAVLACLQAIENGWQAAFMAPTEILAEQHFRKLSPLLSALGVRCAWVSGSQRKAERAAAWQAIAAGEVDLAFGTHALFQEAGSFARLGLAVVDEQHRFGVGQRLALMQKGTEPHQLMMSATPIPRTLAMSFFADLDVSVIDALPPGRTPVVTKLVSAARRDDVLARVREACLAGGQAYWVCPLIEESEKLQLQTAQDTYVALTAQLPELRIGLVHGRLKPDEKQAVMAAFQAHEIDLLVATTVIEVGVDVPNAALMVIEHAERMGLAQLHQLRGRVGRGSRESVCVLLYQTPLSELARARLKVIFELTDGFRNRAARTCCCAVPANCSATARAACRCCGLPIWSATSRCWKPHAIWRSAVSPATPTSPRATWIAGSASGRRCRRSRCRRCGIMPIFHMMNGSPCAIPGRAGLPTRTRFRARCAAGSAITVRSPSASNRAAHRFASRRLPPGWPAPTLTNTRCWA